jgi:hypothetical protein
LKVSSVSTSGDAWAEVKLPLSHGPSPGSPVWLAETKLPAALTRPLPSARLLNCQGDNRADPAPLEVSNLSYGGRSLLT